VNHTNSTAYWFLIPYLEQQAALHMPQSQAMLIIYHPIHSALIS